MPTNIESLPEELLSHILVRLPADYLYDIARLVCRKWYHIIHSDAFIKTQIHHSTYGLVISPFRHWCDHPIYVTATVQGRIETSELSYKCRTKISASCNGLAVELHHRDNNSLSLRVINPATKQPFLLPSVSTRNRKIFPNFCGIAYSAASMVYKVTLPYLVPLPFPQSLRLDILTVGVDKSWRHVQFHHLLPEHVMDFFSQSPLTTEGFLHWEGNDHILTLNVETEIFTVSQLPLPPQAYWYKNRYYFLSMERYLSLLVARGDFSWEIWEMKPETGEWRKLLNNIELEAQKCRLQQFASQRDELFLLPLGWVKYLEVLAFCFSGDARVCIFYNLNTHEIDSTELPESDGGYSALVHRNSLVCLS